ncbi:MAG: hypothetical protein IJT66_03600, partial [Clostridia bacterium]|nr:hypothetical protein [Clostridia bacterium]
AISLWTIVFFYSMVSLILCAVFQIEPIDIKSLVKAVFPFFIGRYWYFTAYIGLMVVQPYLIRFIDALSLKQTRKLLLLSVLFFGVGGWIGGITSASTWLGVWEGYSSLWLIILYSVGFAIKKYGEKLFFGEKTFDSARYILAYLFSALLMTITTVILNQITSFLLGRPVGVHFFYSYLSPLVIVGSVSCFMFFVKLKIDPTKKGFSVVKYVGSLTFGIYIAHCTPFFAGLWPIIKNDMDVLQQHIPLLYCFLIPIGTILIFMVCALAEIVRKKLFAIIRLELLIGKTASFLQNKFINAFRL